MQERSEATCHMAMPQCCYLAKGAKRPSHTTNTIQFDRILFDPCNSIKRFDLCPFDQKNSTYLQPHLPRPPDEKCIHCLLIRDTSQFYALQPRWRWFPGCIKSLYSDGWDATKQVEKIQVAKGRKSYVESGLMKKI